MNASLFLDLHKTHKPPRRERTTRQLWLLYAYAHLRFYLTRSDFWLRHTIRLDMHLQRAEVITIAQYHALTEKTIAATRRRHQ